MHITEVRASIPRATNAPTDWRAAIAQIAVEVETDSGLVGLGVGGGGKAGVHVVESVLRELLLGADPTDIEGLWSRMYRATLPFGRKGLAIMAISGVDLALWDLAGKAAGKPVYELLGGRRHDRIPAYASIGHVVSDEVEQGFEHVKLHMPDFSGDLPETIAIVRTARQRIGPDVKLYVDAFLKWDLDTTLRLADAFVSYQVEWIEEPLPPDDLDGYAELVRRCPIPIAGGEHEYLVAGFRELLDRQAHVILQPDASWCGGLTQLCKIFALGQERSVWVVPHRGAEVWGLHALVALSDRPLAEAGRPWIDWLRGAPAIRGGGIQPSDRPGFGVELDRTRLV